MKFKDLPPHVRKIAEQRTLEFGNTPSDELKLIDAFWWMDTPEGNDVWDAVDDGDFSYFEKFSVSDRVYLDSEFGRYEGKVISVNDNTIEIDFETPSGRSSAISHFDLDGVLWKKHYL